MFRKRLMLQGLILPLTVEGSCRCYADMRVPFILQKSHLFVFMKEILRKYSFLGKKYIDLVTLWFIFIHFAWLYNKYKPQFN